MHLADDFIKFPGIESCAGNNAMPRWVYIDNESVYIYFQRFVDMITIRRQVLLEFETDRKTLEQFCGKTASEIIGQIHDPENIRPGSIFDKKRLEEFIHFYFHHSPPFPIPFAACSDNIPEQKAI